MHKPVLLNKIIEYLDPKSNENFIDCTVGEGGHSSLILEKISPYGKLLGIDLDKSQIENCQWLKEKFNGRVILVNDSYENLSEIVKNNNFENINGILLDLGFSSFQTDQSKKGFSFLRNEPLDMRYNTEIQNSNVKIQNELTAEKIINEWAEEEIKNILEKFGEEKFAKQIAKEIIKQRKIKKIKTTFDLVKIIKKALPFKFHYNKIHFATRTFQALRIAVNKELENLEIVLPQAISVLNKAGRFTVISFHSLEDRIVKNFFREQENKKNIKILTKKPIISGEEEIKINPRARSAKMRAAIKI